MDEFLHLLVDPAHWAFEGVTDLLFAGVGVVWHSWWVKRHDRREHHGD